MNLKEYLDETGCTLTKFAKRANMSVQTIRNILDGKDMYLSIASKIEVATKGNVTCQDLIANLSKKDLTNKALESSNSSQANKMTHKETQKKKKNEHQEWKNN